jgi:2-polyprenyl-6-methoxyphenol hydroxylase-like FAD-dependent oxidoreductase
MGTLPDAMPPVRCIALPHYAGPSDRELNMSTSQTSSSPCQVLVVGAGPTGLVLAAQLLARGVWTRVIDKAAAPASLSRAVSIHARVLELLDTMGLAETFIAHGHQVRRFRMYAGRRNLLNLDMSRNGSRHGFILHIVQNETERLLRARVEELGGTVEHGVELVRLSDDGEVDATVRDVAGHETQVSADYLVGCDGAHSRVRRELGLAFQGQAYPHHFLLADVALDGIDRDDETRAFFRPDGLPLICIPMGEHRWRLVMPHAGDPAGQSPSLEEIQDLVAQRAPWPLQVSDPGWLAWFRCQMRSTTTYRRGRVLLAGDAAHIHSPAGGQGLNTGMMDANNLAWKLALVAHGAAEGLLDSYGQERVPVASGVLGFTDKMMRLSTMRHPVKRAVRDTLLPAATGLPMVQKRAARRLSQVSVGYESSALIMADGAGRAPKPGERVPDVELHTNAGATRLYRALREGRHLLLVSGVETRTVLENAGIDSFSGLFDVAEGDLRGTGRRSAGTSGDFALVRPDGVLAARGSRHDTDRAIEYLRQLSGAGPRRSE